MKYAPMSTTAKRVYRQVSAEQRALERRERLLDTALDLFAAHGYAQCSIESICAAAKVATRHFYQAFSSREALLMCLYEQLIQDLQQAFMAVLLQEQLSGEAKIEQLIAALMQHYLADRRRAQIGVLEVVGASPSLERRRREVIHGIASIIETFMNQMAENGRVPKRNYRMIAIAIVGGINELIADWLVRQSCTLDEIEQEMHFTIRCFIWGVTHQPIHATQEII